MDVDMKVKEEVDDRKDRERERDRDRDADRDRDRERRDRDKERDRERDRDRERERDRRDPGECMVLSCRERCTVLTDSSSSAQSQERPLGARRQAQRRGEHPFTPISFQVHRLTVHVQRRVRRSRSRSPRSRSRSRRRSGSPRRRARRSRSRTSRSRSRSPRSRSRERRAGGEKGGSEPFARSLGGPMNAPHEEASEFAKQSKRENRVYVGNLSYDVKYRDLMEFMRGGGWGILLASASSLGRPRFGFFDIAAAFAFRERGEAVAQRERQWMRQGVRSEARTEVNEDRVKAAEVEVAGGSVSRGPEESCEREARLCRSWPQRQTWRIRMERRGRAGCGDRNQALQLQHRTDVLRGISRLADGVAR